MKVIDLYVKIANDELEDTKFIFDNAYFKYFKSDKRIDRYTDSTYTTVEYHNDTLCDYENLNDEVEITEERKEIEKIEVTKDNNSKRFIEYDDETGHHKYTIRLIDEYFANKINYLLDEVNKLNKESDE